jgi:glucose/mannose-6-phosphate isomerase
MNINDIKEISDFDSGRVAESIVLLPNQILDIAKQTKKIKFPSSYSNINKVVVSGMGGSNLGASIIASVFKEELKVPLIIEASYTVPNFVDKNTLFILSSYSGLTEETLSVYKEVKKRKAKITVVSAKSVNNRLYDLMLKDKLPGLIFEPLANPSNQPRLALGYAFFGLLFLLLKVRVLKLKKMEERGIVKELLASGKKMDIGVSDNPAKKLAAELFGRQIFICGGDFLEGNLHTLRNQFCENSKQTASYLVLPDMNHYALEGLSNPAGNKDNLVFLFFKSSLYSPAIQSRLTLTEQVVEKNGIKALSWELKSKTKTGQAAEMLQAGSWITFYLAFLNGVDPVKIPWVDWFKEKLAESVKK